MKKHITTFVNFLSRFFVLSACLLLSTFIYLNIIEKMALVDLPHISSVSKTTYPNLIYQVENGNNPTNELSKYGFFGKPIVLRIPLRNYSLSIGEEKIENGSWIVSNQVASYHVFSESQGGNIGNFVIFVSPGSGHLAIADLLVEGDRIVIDTNKNWRYNFRVTKRLVVPTEQKYLADHSNSSQLILIRDKSNGRAVIVESTLLSIEERNTI